MEHNLHRFTDNQNGDDTFKILCRENVVAEKTFKKTAYPEEIQEWVQAMMDEHRSKCPDKADDAAV